MSASPSALRLLHAGVARADITPPIGIRLWGYTVQEGCAQSVERPLTATVLVLSDGETSAVLIGLDLLFVPLPLSDRIRAEIGRRLGIPGENVLLNGNHTHLGPMLPGWQPEDPPQHDLQARYAQQLEAIVVEAASAAWAGRRPARLGTGRGSAPLGVNRREKLPDDGIIIGENPGGPIDRTVDVIRIDDLRGTPIAVVMSAACHTVVLGPKTLTYSPDFIGPARELIEPAIGAPSLFLQGAAGNVNPACGIGAGGPEQFEDLHRMGVMLGGETLKVWAQIRTHNQRGPRRVVRSVARISTWDYEPTPEATLARFSVARRRLHLPLAALPDLATAEADLTRTKAAREAAFAGDALGPRQVAQRMYAWAEQRHRLVSAGHTSVTREIELWALRINDLAIASVSAEPLAELGLEIKRRSPAPHTVYLGYSNGCIGYIPPPEAFAVGGMEVVESHYNYLLASQLTPEWAPTVVEATLEMLMELE